MSTVEERTKILNMVAEGKITAEEASSLLKALQGADRKSSGTSSRREGMASGTLRVRVINAETQKVKVNVGVPMSLVDVALRMGARFAPELGDVELHSVMEAIRAGQKGKILEVEDDIDGEVVEIYVE